MITEDQPTIFNGTNLVATMSSISDGQMVVEKSDPDTVIANINSFVDAPDELALIRCTYDRDTFDKIAHIDDKSTLWKSDVNNRFHVDAMITSNRDITLAVPVADCLCVITFDPIKQVLAIAHLGRHGTVDNLVEKVISVMKTDYDCNPTNLLCYLSPSIKQESYGLDYFDMSSNALWRPLCKEIGGKVHIDIPGYNYNALVAAGVPKSNIEVSSVNTATSSNYGSHFINARDPSKSDYRFLVTARMT